MRVSHGFLFFINLAITTEAMGICPSADGGSIRCPSADGQGELKTSEANAGLPAADRSKTAGIHSLSRCQPMNIGVS